MRHSTHRGRHFLLYWQQWAIDYVLEQGRPVRRIGSSHFKRASAGDTIWIAGAAGGRLHLAGRVRAAEVLSRRLASERAGKALTGRYYAFARSGTAERPRRVDITRLTPELRFESERDRLIADNPLFWPLQLQTMRTLTASSARMLERAWTR